jgi:cysteine desulfuration protein SufE
MSIAEIQQELVDDFEFFDDWADKYAYIISLGKQLTPYPEDKKDDAHFIKGCQSQVWLDISLENERLKILGTSDAAIVSGLIALLIKIYDGATPKAVLTEELTLLKDIGLENHLSPTRNNGLHAMLKGIMTYASKNAA